MTLRPIDAIFVHPKLRCFVVYHNGELWQLTRMKLDLPSWQRRRPYQGDPDSLYLSRQQKIEDPKLADHLHTLPLPAILHGINLTKFKDWWRLHGFDWSQNQPEAAQRDPAALKSNTAVDKTAQTQATCITDTINKKRHHDQASPPLSTASSDSQSVQTTNLDIFDTMLNELNESIKK